jgi:nitrogen fixation protein
MINPTINQLIDRFRAFADGHFYIRAFEVGALNESDLTKDMTYPFMNIEYANTNPVPRQNSYTFIVSFADLPRRKDEVRQNIQEIHSDLTLIALDLLKEIRNGNVLFGEDIDFADGVVITPFTDENHNFISGVTMELTITAPDNWNACIIPADFAVGGTGYPSESLRVFSLPIYDEGNFVVDAYDINFVGSGVTVTHVGNRAVVTITDGGGGGGLTCEDLPECATIISIESRLDSLETDKENVGVAQDIMDDHLAAANPHPQYALDSDLSGYVPYTGATTNVDLGTHNLTADHIALNVNPSGAGFVVGSTQWNNSLGSSQTLLKGGNVILKNGVDLVARIVNKVTPNTTLTKASYQAVRVSGATGGRLSVALARADSDANSADTIGLVCETIAPNQEGFIITVGQLLDVNTTGSLQGETWVDGDVLYLSPTTAGKITKVKPTGTGHIVVIGYVEYAHANNGSIYVKVMNGWELDELHDVDITNVQNNDFLRYNSTSGTWKNHALTKTDVGLGNVDNTSDANKPISTATQTALNAKENTITAGTTSQYYRGDKTFQTLNGTAVSNDSNVVGSTVKDALNTIQAELDINTLVALSGSDVTTTSATAVDVTGLVTPTLPPNSTWSFEIYLTVTCSGTGGLRFGFTAPIGANGGLFIVGTATTQVTYQQTSTAGALSVPAINRAATSSLGTLYGRVIIGANAGAVQLQFASGTGGQLSTITGTGISIMKITRVA